MLLTELAPSCERISAQCLAIDEALLTLPAIARQLTLLSANTSSSAVQPNQQDDQHLLILANDVQLLSDDLTGLLVEAGAEVKQLVLLTAEVQQTVTLMLESEGKQDRALSALVSQNQQVRQLFDSLVLILSLFNQPIKKAAYLAVFCADQNVVNSDRDEQIKTISSKLQQQAIALEQFTSDQQTLCDALGQEIEQQHQLLRQESLSLAS